LIKVHCGVVFPAVESAFSASSRGPRAVRACSPESTPLLESDNQSVNEPKLPNLQPEPDQPALLESFSNFLQLLRDRCIRHRVVHSRAEQTMVRVDIVHFQ
jgi:hypothetical protein